MTKTEPLISLMPKPFSIADLSPEVVQRARDRLLAEYEAQRVAAATFAASSVFAKMRDRLTQAGPKSVDQEECGYFPDRVRKRLGWQFATEADMAMFFKVLSDVHAPTVVAGSVKSDEDCPFDNFDFEHYGLVVHVLIGQGSMVTIMNKEAAAGERTSSLG